MAKLRARCDSHWGAVQIQPNSRLPGRQSKEHWSHKDGENMTWIGSLFFLHIKTHIELGSWIDAVGKTQNLLILVTFCVRVEAFFCTGFYKCIEFATKNVVTEKLLKFCCHIKLVTRSPRFYFYLYFIVDWILDLFYSFRPFWTNLESFWIMLDHYWIHLFEPYFSYFS